MVKSKHKGNRFESEVAKVLSEWAGETFKRLPASGALRWGGVTWVYGDLLPPENWHLVVECKHHKKVEVEDLLGNRIPGVESQIAEWWFGQTVPDAERASEELKIPVTPMLVFKHDYGRLRAIFDFGFFVRATEGRGDLERMDVKFPGKDTFVLTDFLGFLESVKPAQFREALRKEKGWQS